jgi:hypothetical protein
MGTRHVQHAMYSLDEEHYLGKPVAPNNVVLPVYSRFDSGTIA